VFNWDRIYRLWTPIIVSNQVCTIVGRVSMDLIAIDLSNCEQAVIGSPVEAWGKFMPVEEVAKSAGTIPYTLLCGISQRVETIVI